MASVHLLCTASNEIRRDQRRLRRTEDQFRLLIDSVEDYAIFMLDPAGIVRTWNSGAERIKGYTAEEIIGCHFSCFYPREDVESGKPAMELETAAESGRFEEEGWRLKKDGTQFWANVVISAVRDKSGSLCGFAKVSRDITVRKEAEAAAKKHQILEQRAAELERSNDELKQFAQVAAHDLQEPLRMVVSYTQLLAKRYMERLDTDANEFISHAVTGANRMQVLIQGLLSYCDVGTAGNAFTETSSAAALDRALVNLQGRIQESCAVVTYDTLPTVTADGFQLTQLFQNLVGNAIKYHSEESPEVHVAASKNENSELVFTVRDNGIGIESQYFERIFGMYQRLHAREKFSGTGIGLAVCKKIAVRHGGRIWVESTPGKGSTFSVAFPD